MGFSLLFVPHKILIIPIFMLFNLYKNTLYMVSFNENQPTYPAKITKYQYKFLFLNKHHIFFFFKLKANNKIKI